MGREPSGLAVVVGVPRMGKTTLAVKLAHSACMATGWPALLVDTTGSVGPMAPWIDVQCETAYAALRETAQGGRHVHYIPKESQHVHDLCEALAVARSGVVLLLDDSAAYFTARRRSEAIVRIFRQHHHLRVACIITTQHLAGDLSGELVSCDAGYFVFRQIEERCLKRCAELGLDPEEIRQLEPRQFQPVQGSWPHEVQHESCNGHVDDDDDGAFDEGE